MKSNLCIYIYIYIHIYIYIRKYKYIYIYIYVMFEEVERVNDPQRNMAHGFPT